MTEVQRMQVAKIRSMVLGVHMKLSNGQSFTNVEQQSLQQAARICDDVLKSREQEIIYGGDGTIYVLDQDGEPFAIGFLGN